MDSERPFRGDYAQGGEGRGGLYTVVDFTVLCPLGLTSSANSYLLFWIGMYACYSKYKFLADSGTSEDFQLKFTFDLSSYSKSKDTWLGIGEWQFCKTWWLPTWISANILSSARQTNLPLVSSFRATPVNARFLTHFRKQQRVFIAGLCAISHLNAKLLISTFETKRAFCEPQFT